MDVGERLDRGKRLKGCLSLHNLDKWTQQVLGYQRDSSSVEESGGHGATLYFLKQIRKDFTKGC